MTRNITRYLILFCILLFSLFSCETQYASLNEENSSYVSNENDSSYSTETISTKQDFIEHEYDEVVVDKLTYHIHKEYIEVYSISPTATEVVIEKTFNGVPITKISENALDAVEDKANFRLFGDSDSIARDYAVEHGCIFIEWFDGSFPNHYYPYNGDESVWVENSNDNDYYYAEDNSKKISSLVTQYLLDGSGYDELLELVLYHIACAAEFDYELGEMLPDYYIREYTSSTVDDYDKYSIYMPEHNGNYPYPMVRYGKFDTYDKIIEKLSLLYTKNIILYGSRIDEILVNVEGYAFQLPIAGPGGTSYKNSHYDMMVYEGAIYLLSSHFDNTREGYEKTEYNSVGLLLREGKWLLDEYYVYNGYESSDYEDYIASRK